MSRKLNFDVNVDGRTDKRTDGLTDGRTDGRTEIWTPISHPAISRCDKNTSCILRGVMESFNHCSLRGHAIARLDTIHDNF